MLKKILLIITITPLIMFANNYWRSERCDWLELGGGVFAWQTNHSLSGICGNVSYGTLRNNTCYKLNAIMASELNLFGNIPCENFISVDFLTGKMAKGPFGIAAINIGLGVLWVEERGDIFKKRDTNSKIFFVDEYNSIQYFVIAIPVELELAFQPLKIFGIGIKLYGNINVRRPLFGMTCSYYIGKLR